MFVRSNIARSFALAGVVAAILSAAAIAQSAREQAKTAPKVSVGFTRVPTALPGENSFGDIAGVVKNAPTGSRVVIYSYGDTWYVQPYVNAPFTDIGKDGKFSSNGTDRSAAE